MWLIYNERYFFCSQISVRFAKLLIFFWKGERFEGPELLVYNEGTFSQPRHRSKEPYMMGSLFGKILPSAAARNPA